MQGEDKRDDGHIFHLRIRDVVQGKDKSDDGHIFHLRIRDVVQGSAYGRGYVRVYALRTGEMLCRAALMGGFMKSHCLCTHSLELRRAGFVP